MSFLVGLFGDVKDVMIASLDKMSDDKVRVLLDQGFDKLSAKLNLSAERKKRLLSLLIEAATKKYGAM